MAQKRTSRLGRPKLPKGAAKSEMVRTRVTKAEYAAIESAAKSSEKDVSEWARNVLIDNATQTQRTDETQ